MRYKPYEFKAEDAFAFADFMHMKTKQTGNELHFLKCPSCGGNGGKDKWSFGIDLRTGMCHCLRNTCGYHGNMITLAQDFGFSLGTEIDEYFVPKKKYKTFKTPKNPIIPKPQALEYLQSRGISEKTAKLYEITVQDSRPNILVFPFYNEKGDLTYVKYRKTDFDKSRDDNKEWCEKGGKPILFGMKQCNLENKTLIVCEGQCFDGKAEILTPEGWIRFEDYAGQDVLQINEKMQGSFVRPKQYIVKRHIGKMVHVEIGGNYETYTTDDHNLVFIDKHGDVVKKQASEKIPTNMHIPTSITINDETHDNWTDDMFALYIAISADGTIDYRKGTGYKKPWAERYVRIAIPLERKVKRIREILENLGIKYSDNTDSKGYQSICFPCPDWLKSKFLPYWFATETTIEQKRFILEEMVRWDGNRVNGRNQYEYNTIIKHNADVMQLIATSCGYMSTVMSKQSGGNGNFKKSYVYKVSILFGKHDVSTKSFEKYKTITEVDQRVYCVTVDTGMILVRQNNRISVTGNCDSLSVAEAGFENAISVPNGAQGFTWVPYCWDFVNKFDTIIVFGDHEKGHITLLEDIKKRFRLNIKHVRPEDYKDCKDANDILRKYGKEQIKVCIDNAETEPLRHVKKMSQIVRRNPYDIPKVKSGILELDMSFYGGLPLGGVVLITGKAGEGKSVFASQILLNAVEDGHKCFAYSGELPDWAFQSIIEYQAAGSHVFMRKDKFGNEKPDISQTNAELIDNWLEDSLLLYDDSILEDEEETERLTDVIEKVILQENVDVILLDNLMTGIELDGGKDKTLYERQSEFVKRLARMARTYNVLIILVAHMRKNNSNYNGNDEVAGSSDITNLASITLMYESSKELTEDQRSLKVWKDRLFGHRNSKGITLDYEAKSKRIYGSGDYVDKEYGWCPQDKFDDVEVPDMVPFE